MAALAPDYRPSSPTTLVTSGDLHYLSEPFFPNNLPVVWEEHWARVPASTGHAVVVGEFGGLWTASTWRGLELPSTRVWQEKLVEFLIARSVGFFYCARRVSRTACVLAHD